MMKIPINGIVQTKHVIVVLEKMSRIDWIVIVLTFLVGLCILLISNGYFDLEESTENKSLLAEEVNKGKYEEILTIVKNISNREYIRDVYDCSDMSTDLVIKLRNFGYESKFIRGYRFVSDDCNDCDLDGRHCWNGSCWGRHAWTRFWVDKKQFDIESTTGRFIYPSQYFKDYIED